jgi:Cd2+/Zn2+-exporting ATPase
MSIESASAPTNECVPRHPARTTQWERYREFLLSRETILVVLNALLLLAGFITSLAGAPQVGHWLYLASALVGGAPLFYFAAKQIIVHQDITSGVMGSVAMIAAIIVGEFSAAAIVVLMMSVGEWLENLTVARADNALRDLARLIPTTVTVCRGGQDVTIPLAQVVLQDSVLVRSGERIAVDGMVLEGAGSVNQAAITGESIPVEKKTGDEVFAGSLNEVGALVVRVTRLGDDTTLGQIVKLVREAQASQAPVQRIANRYARILVPITFVIALAVFLLSGQILRAITILVVVCPCALILATPTAVAAAIGNAAKRGILVKSGAVIEQVGKVEVVALDKTGTITFGRPEVTEVLALDRSSRYEVLALAASAERDSEHPLGRAIVLASQAGQLNLSAASDTVILPGFGVSARVGEQEVIVGNRALLAEHGIAISVEREAQVGTMEDQGKTVIYMAANGELVGLIALADMPRPEAQQAIAEMKRMGIREVVMITGDNPRAAQMVARAVGVDRVFAEVLPQDKLKIIRTLQAEGKRVTFVGDGINDAPALDAADVGIAMGLAGTDVALETAGIGLMADEIERLPQIIALSRQTLRIIRQNVIFSMSVNLLSVFLGGFGIIGPVFGAMVHELSSLPVLANAARLINYEHKRII